MNTMTSTLTKTSTNTKLAVATAFLAVASAFAFIPALTTNNKFQGCRDLDAPVDATFDERQLFVKSTTTYNGGTSTDRCYTFPTTGKTYVMEGVCKKRGFQTWQKNCGELNIGQTGVNYQCVEGACVNVATSTPPSTGSLSVFPTTLDVPSTAGSNASVAVSSSVSWNVSDNQDWLTVSPLTGSNNGTLSISYTANSVASSRSGVVTIVAGAITQTVMVTQAAASSTVTSSPFLSVSPETVSVPASAGSNNTITISSNRSWTVSDNQDWLTVVPANGSNNGSLTVSYTANAVASTRSAVVTVVSGGLARTVMVTQAAASSTPATPTSTYLNATIDTNYTGLRNDHYVLAGTQKHLIGRVQLSASGEDVKIKQLGLNILSSDSLVDVKNTFHSITIYKDSAMTIPLGIMPTSLGTVVFQNLNHVVSKNTTKYLYIGVGLNRIGPASNTSSAAVSNVSLNFGLKDAQTAAMGVVSGVDLLPQNVVATENVYTKIVTSIGSQVTNVASTFQNGNLLGGEQTFFTFAVTADSGVNTDVLGDSLSAYLVSMKLQLATDANVTSTKLCRVSTGSCISLYAVPTAVSGVYRLQTQTPGYTGFVNLVLFDNLGAGGMSNRVVQNGETVLYEVRGTFSNVTDRYAQGSIQDVHDSGIVWGYDTRGYGGEPLDITFTDLKKMEPRWSGYPDVVGGTLN